MVEFLAHNRQFVFLISLWVSSAFFVGPLASLVVLISLLLFIRRGYVEDLFLGFVIILVISDNLFPSMSFAKSFKNIYIVLLGLYFILKYSEFNHFSRLYLYFIPFFAFALVGLFYSPVLATSIQKTISYFLLLLIVPNLVIQNYNINGSFFFRNLIYTMFFICLIGLIFNFINPEVSISHGGRFRGIFGNPNGMGIYLILFTLLFTVVRKRFTDLFSRSETLIIYGLILLLIILTGSRTAMLSVLLFFAFSFFFRISFILGIIFFLVTILLTEYFIKNSISIIQNLGLSSELRAETLDEGSGRLIAWEFAWLEIKRNLFFGQGIAYDEFYMRSNYETLSQLGHEGGVHNTYLIIWLNTGLLGLISYFISFFTLFIQSSFKDKLALPVMISVMFSIIFEPWLASSLNPYTIIFLVTLTLLFEKKLYPNEKFEEDNKNSILLGGD